MWRTLDGVDAIVIDAPFGQTPLEHLVSQDPQQRRYIPQRSPVRSYLEARPMRTVHRIADAVGSEQNVRVHDHGDLRSRLRSYR